MPRKAAKPSPPSSRWPGIRLVGALIVTLAVVAGVLAGLGALGDKARDRIFLRDRYRVRFADIRCDVPPGHNRETFLMEVRYVGAAPESFQLLDRDLSDMLSAAFASHPWVEAVDGVEIHPPRDVSVRLRFRKPVLMVKLLNGERRLVDRNCVLLPISDHAGDLPVLIAAANVPQVAAGQVWDEPDVKRAVELVRRQPLTRLEKTGVGWTITALDGTMTHIAK